jgi:hypothetical protein
MYGLLGKLLINTTCGITCDVCEMKVQVGRPHLTGRLAGRITAKNGRHSV